MVRRREGGEGGMRNKVFCFCVTKKGKKTGEKKTEKKIEKERILTRKKKKKEGRKKKTHLKN